MIEPEDLEWGQTPFDDMTREELLHEVKTQFNAVMSAASALHALSYHDSASPFWEYAGTGGRAKMQIDSIIKRVNNDRNDGLEAISQCYFRYADQLLFPELTDGRSEWWVNSQGHMVGGNPNKNPEVASTYEIWGWVNDWRPITFDDLKPLPVVDNAVDADQQDS